MASSLKYVTPPAKQETRIVGNEKTCGTIEIKIIGGLTSEEEAANVNLFNYSKPFFLAWKNLCDLLTSEQQISAIEEETGVKIKRLMTQDEAHKAVTRIIFNEESLPLEDKLKAKYKDQLNEIAKELEKALQGRRLDMVTACIRSRLGYKNWNLQDTGGLHSELLQAISDVLDEEIETKNNLNKSKEPENE